MSLHVALSEPTTTTGTVCVSVQPRGGRGVITPCHGTCVRSCNRSPGRADHSKQHPPCHLVHTQQTIRRQTQAITGHCVRTLQRWSRQLFAAHSCPQLSCMVLFHASHHGATFLDLANHSVLKRIGTGIRLRIVHHTMQCTHFGRCLPRNHIWWIAPDCYSSSLRVCEQTHQCMLEPLGSCRHAMLESSGSNHRTKG